MKIQNAKYQFIALGLLIFLNLNFFTKLYIISDFYLHRDEISTNLCVQRKVKNNCCQGKCQLEKRLSKASKSSEGNNPVNRTESQQTEFGSLTWMIQFAHISADVARYSKANEFPSTKFTLYFFSPEIPSPPPRFS